MADFRKLLPAVAMLALVAFTSMPASAQAPGAFACTATAGVPPLARAEGITELVGDIVLNCSGGSGAAITANVQIFLNTNVTSRIITGNTTEALLLLGEPAAATLGTNAFQGQLAGANSLVWLGVPILPGGTTEQTIRITNVRANATGVTTVNPNLPPSLIPSQIVALISISGTTSVPVNNPQQIVAFVQPGLVSSAGSETLRQCFSQNTNNSTDGKSAVALTYNEGFATSFKPRLGPGQTANNGTATSTSVPGAIANSESGFLISGQSLGLADFGTRVQAVFENVPAGATVWVTSKPVSGPDANLVSGGTTTASFGTTEVNGTAYSSGWTALTVSGSTATAVWEFVDPDPFAVETAVFGVLLSYTSNPAGDVPSIGTMTVRQSFSPLSTVTTASATAPIPRFVDNSTARNVFTINACVTNLLFPFVTTAPGFDTGIAISNTSLDSPVFSTSAQTGACTLYFFGPGAPTEAPVTPTVTPGTSFAFSLWNGSGNIAPLRDFTGYLIARCTFQYAHGYAFISDLGSSRFAQGYLALVIPDRANRPADPFPSAGSGSGEQLGN